jgi:hypothetical protein
MPLQIGTWKSNASGALSSLVITGVDTTGHLSGTFAGNRILGFWDEAAQKISFLEMVDLFTFVGFLSQDQFRMPGITGSTVFTLAGHYVAFSAIGSADRSTFGWYAQIGTT